MANKLSFFALGGSVEQANKASPRFHPGKTSELIITNLRNSHIVLSKQPKDGPQNFLIGQWAKSIFIFSFFFQKIKKMAPV